MNNLVVRALTGAVFVAILLGAFYLGSIATFFLFGIVVILGLSEFYQLFQHHTSIQPCRWTGIIGGTLLYVVLLYPYLFHQIASFRLAAIPIVALTFIIELYRNKTSPIANLGVLLLGWLYIISPFYLAVIITMLGGEMGSYVLMSLFIIVWTNDTFAYLTGRFFGKRKLFERISPKKTWEGTLGGISFALIAGVLVASFLGMDMIFWLIGAFLIAVTSIYGDLFESLLKRSVGVKDSGNILPGHGGILDRFDAVIYAIPFFYVWLIIYN